MPKGKVILVGSGPGNPGLVSLRGLVMARAADVVVHDRLIASDLLGEARPGAEIIDVGKMPGGPRASQEEIHRILIDRARAGKLVVRLKGGDPFVFGRGGEEALALAEAGIPFEVVPGITAGIAAAACAGIPVTHRGLASCVTLVTGHEDPAKSESDLDYEALAATGGTLVFYMGVKQLNVIARRLIDAGLAPDTPAAVIERGTTAAQRSVRGTLATMARAAAEARIEPPAITVVGAVAGLPEELNWFERRPLFGKRIVNTRPVGQAQEFADELAALGAEVIALPTIEYAAPASWSEADAALARLGDFDWVIFTSANAVEVAFERLGAAGRDARAFGRAKIACIGPATAEALGTHALRADFIPANYTAEALLRELDEAGQSPASHGESGMTGGGASTHRLRGARVLLPRSDIARAELREGLAKLGADVTEVVLYRTRTNSHPPADVVERVRRGECDVVTFTSASTVRGFVEILGPAAVAQLNPRVKFASIGPVTSQEMRALGLDVAVEATEHTTMGLAQVVTKACGA